MTFDAREFARTRNLVLLVAALAWIAIFAKPGMMSIYVHSMGGAAMPFGASLQTMFTMSPIWTLTGGLLLMLAAMMSPVLIPPIYYIRMRSFTHRRMRSVALFVAAYAGIWTVAGASLLAIELVVKSLVPHSYLPAAGSGLAAILWQCSPIKQICLNRCHAHNELAAFGFAADLAALRFGVAHAVWCAGSCWALMLLPMLFPEGHMVAMAAVTTFVFAERGEPTKTPCWQWRYPNRLMRFVAAQLA